MEDRRRCAAMQDDSPRAVPEIREAIVLFEKWESAITDPAAAGWFVEAVQLLDDYLEAEPRTPHAKFVHNLKLSNARRLLQLLKQVGRKDESSWMEYVNALFLMLKDQAGALIAANPDLRADYEAFVSAWGKQYLAALEQAADKRSD
jgi:hypothetical protein